MADLGLLKESSQTPKPKASEIMPSKGNADKSFIKPDAIVKREVETDSHISLPPISNTPIIDSLWGANRPTEPSQREALLAKVKSNLLNRGHPDVSLLPIPPLSLSRQPQGITMSGITKTDTCLTCI